MAGEKDFKIALIQLFITEDKDANVKNALKFIEIAKNNNCGMAILPECFNCPYGTSKISRLTKLLVYNPNPKKYSRKWVCYAFFGTFFPQYAEEIPNGKTCRALSECAKKQNIFVVGGSIPESDGGKLYNTCTVWNPKGELVAKHRKVHLFDVDIPGKITFQESEALTPGSTFNLFDTGKFKVGLGICHDSRFPELAQYYQKQGCKLVIYPGAFCGTLGPPHWKLLLQSRALDNQLYVAGVSGARNEEADYVSYGHTTLVNYYGQVEAATEYDEDIIYGLIDLDKLEEFRQTVPILKQKRSDLYEIRYKQ